MNINMTTIQEMMVRFDLDQYAPEEHGNVVAFRVRLDEWVSVCQSIFSSKGLRLLTVLASDDRKESGSFRVSACFGVPKENLFLVPYITIDPAIPKFPSLAKSIHQAGGYEQEIHSFFGLVPEGHPDLRRVNLHDDFPDGVFPLRKDFDGTSHPTGRTGTPYTFRMVEGEGIYEIPVGPVHAGIIEPGHFRFSVLGEEILAFEAKLGYVHKGVEKLFESKKIDDQVRLAERVSGDSSVAHALAFLQGAESLAGMGVPLRAQYIRMICAELERMANHFGDIAFILFDTGFSFGGSHGVRLRERMMRWQEKISGSRHGRGMIVFGGVGKDIPTKSVDALADDLELIEKDLEEIVSASMESDSLLNRLKRTGTLEREIAFDHGVTGVPLRALGTESDARIDFPYAAYESVQFAVPTETTGDVYARLLVRIRELRSSFRILNQVLALLPGERSGLVGERGSFRPKSIALGITEGWRGDIVYCLMTDATGQITRVKVRDPSFLNWQIFPYILGNDVVPDFPLINKSFNLSYSGNDL
jgi:Ni,Fe-hydrogenase III large subunit/Ni,Fe-hydrogenase III component G